MPRIKPTDYRVTYHGLDHSSYFQGHGVSFSKFTDCATGIGSSESEALDDALDQLAMGDWDVSAIETELKEEIANLEKMAPAQEEEISELLHGDCPDKGENCEHDCDLYYYVSVDVVDENQDLTATAD